MVRLASYVQALVDTGTDANRGFGSLYSFLARACRARTGSKRKSDDLEEHEEVRLTARQLTVTVSQHPKHTRTRTQDIVGGGGGGKRAPCLA